MQMLDAPPRRLRRCGSWTGARRNLQIERARHLGPPVRRQWSGWPARPPAGALSSSSSGVGGQIRLGIGNADALGHMGDDGKRRAGRTMRRTRTERCTRSPASSLRSSPSRAWAPCSRRTKAHGGAPAHLHQMGQDIGEIRHHRHAAALPLTKVPEPGLRSISPRGPVHPAPGDGDAGDAIFRRQRRLAGQAAFGAGVAAENAVRAAADRAGGPSAVSTLDISRRLPSLGVWGAARHAVFYKTDICPSDAIALSDVKAARCGIPRVLSRAARRHPRGGDRHRPRQSWRWRRRSCR